MNGNNLTRHILLMVAAVGLLLSCAGAGERARMAALLEKVEQMDQDYLPLDTVTFMEEVLDFYMAHGNEDERIRANYMMGGVYRDRGDSPMALEYYLKAVNQADTTDENCNFKKLNRIYFQMANLYHKQFFCDKEIEMLQKCLLYSRKSKEKRLEILAESYMADAYSIKGDKQKALELCKKTTKEFLDNGYIVDAATNTSQLLEFYMEEDRLDEARTLLDRYLEYSHLEGDSGRINVQSNFIFYDLGHYYEKKGLLDSAIISYKKLVTNSDINILENAYQGLMSAYLKKGNADSACTYATLFAEANDSSISIRSIEEINRAKSLYDYTFHQNQAKEKAEELSILMRILMFITFFFFCFVTICYIIYIKYKVKAKQRKVEMNALSSGYNKALIDLKKIKEENSKLKQDSANELDILKKKLDVIKDYNQSDIWDDEQILLNSAIVERFIRYARKAGNYTPAPSEWKDLLTSVEAYLPVFYKKIMEYELLDTEQKICILTRLNFSPKDMCNLMGISSQSTTNIRSSINKKMFNENGAKTLKNNLTMHISD